MSGRFPQRFGDDVVVTDVDLDTEEVYYHDERLTEQRAERIATEALPRLRRGRRSLSGDGSHSPTVQFRVPDVLLEAVQARAQADGVPVSVLARRALQAYLEAPAPPTAEPQERQEPQEQAPHRGPVAEWPSSAQDLLRAVADKLPDDGLAAAALESSGLWLMVQATGTPVLDALGPLALHWTPDLGVVTKLHVAEMAATDSVLNAVKAFTEHLLATVGPGDAVLLAPTEDARATDPEPWHRDARWVSVGEHPMPWIVPAGVWPRVGADHGTDAPTGRP